ncbi:hypothetical protein [Bifidobacterium vespertilionis]|uniref:exo-rhamnogalacturonan lyase family protein n=1 Tax=Bifidobacterium vespertilionis TaxID=2562524 RepID=UPI001BDC8D81|nr:hypothetical protein [Bifidobacterium vespertilionis]MBT1178485.1 hypothetical protein [Bifidobacterium vespertilionis]
MKIHLLPNRSRAGHVTFGGYWSRGEAPADAAFALADASGLPIDVQSAPAAYWSDGSIKWSTHTADAFRIGDEAELSVLPAGAPVPSIGRAVTVEETEDHTGYIVHNGVLSLIVPKPGGASKPAIAMNVMRGDVPAADRIYPVFDLERRDASAEGTCETRSVTHYEGVIDAVTVEQSGPVQVVFRFDGRHIPNPRIIADHTATGPDDPVDMPEPSMPFVIRLAVCAGEKDLKLTHTFAYDGKESRDFLKGMGIRVDLPLTGHAHEHHVHFQTDNGTFHEAAEMFFGNHWDQSPAVLRRQLDGDLPDAELTENLRKAEADLPIWNRYALVQDASSHFRIVKQTKPGCCELTCDRGSRAPGAMAVTGTSGGVMIGMRDFWRKYPGELEVAGLGTAAAQATAWFHAPAADAYDFRHYDTRTYTYTCYEGFDYMLSTAYGVAVTSEATIRLLDAMPKGGQVADFAAQVDRPAVAVGAPEYYHAKRAFGEWSLPTAPDDPSVKPSERWLENELAKAFDYYKAEVEHRDWYGLFDYGDVMHTYDPARHVWRYDVGGFAWQNTELIPTYWLWTYFLRTGREDVYTLAEAMTRHTSEVDIYHFGPLQGLGTRHNVRHWGCSCKEPRIAMAGHHRFLYYLSGDARVGDVMNEVLPVDLTIKRRGKGGDGASFPVDGDLMPTRSGPDWSSFVSNWLTAYERTLDPKYREWIERGVNDIAAAPFRLISGPSFMYDVKTKDLKYMGEDRGTPNQHLQLCQGGIQIWAEVADELDLPVLREMLVEEGSFYTLSAEEKLRRCGDEELAHRSFGWPSLITEILGLAAADTNDEKLGRFTWDVLFDTVLRGGDGGYNPTAYTRDGGGRTEYDIPWNSTNCTSRWALGVIDNLEYIRQWLPDEVPTDVTGGDFFH